MKLLHVTSEDLAGRRFSGYDLLSQLEPRGIGGTQAVLRKSSHDERVFSLLDGQVDWALQDALERVERRRSMRNLLFPWGRVLERSPAFLAADVIHYHLIHNEVISLLDLPRLMGAKPSVWSMHDPWALTGHCIHPMDCQGWLTGCTRCPSLDAVFPMEEDHAGRMWSVKEHVFAQMDPDIVVSSPFMLDMVRRSPLTAHFQRVHLIPFGIDAEVFLPETEKSASRRRLGIPQDRFVLLFRSTDLEFKGLEYIVEALASRPPDRPTTLLTVDQKGLLRVLGGEYDLVEMGWVSDEDLYRRLFSACDALLMPSVAESFGLMALEAMAAGRPVICFEGTTLPSITHAPECGIAVPMGDSRALRDAIDELAADDADAARRGHLAREIALTEHSHQRYLDGLVALYEEVLARRR